VVAASGDFDRDQMVGKLEKLFAEWPFRGDLPPPIPTNTSFANPGVYVVNKPDVNQGRVAMMLPGVMRDDPDYFAVTIMNDILGGGGFTSRIMNRVRSDEGLAYSAYSSIPGGIYYPLTVTSGFQSKSRTVAYAASLILEEFKRIASEPVNESELTLAKRGFIERFPRTFGTKAQVANQFAMDEFTGRYAKDPDYWKTVRPKIEAVTLQDIQRVAREHLKMDKLVILAVGNKEEMLLGHPNHPVKLDDLVGGGLKELPLRDPLTMKPLPLNR
jgi:predicted Zn-dependent peptidase